MGRPGPLTVGTAGHVDHGKTALVEALTGKNTDRLPEELHRGLSIELGFAELNLGERRLSLVDVPGHERFVRTMVAGATGVDMFLMVIAADDGVMPQTREHLTVLRSLGVEHGVVALTKCDLADQASRSDARQQADELLPGAAIIDVCAPRGEGIAELKDALQLAAARVDSTQASRRKDGAQVALHVDRVFTVAGRGTVVTGTLWSGHVRRGDRVALLPARLEARVREIQIHDRSTEVASPRQRVALNLAGVGRNEVHRGEVVTSLKSDLHPTYRLDVELPLGQPPDGERVQIHHGTREVPARFVALGDKMAQLRLEAPLVALPGDRFVIRRISPPGTWGGGAVLDAQPRRHGPGSGVERLKLIRRAEAEEILEAVLSDSPEGIPIDFTVWSTVPVLGAAVHRFPEECWRGAVATLLTSGRAIQQGARLTAPSAKAVKDPSTAPRLHDAPLDDLGQRALAALKADGMTPRHPRALAQTLSTDFADVVIAFENLVMCGAVTRIKPGIYYEAKRLAVARQQIIELMRQIGPITVAALRDEMGISRKYAQALLEYLDGEGVTLRRDDHHLLRRQYALD